jgi:hypothetical protein
MKTHAYLMVLLVFILAQCPYDSIFAQGSGAGAKKNYKPIWLSDCEKQLEEFKKEIEVEPMQHLLPIWEKHCAMKAIHCPYLLEWAPRLLP